MNVKCPKCRFRFDVNASPGMSELQCNCPRCGMPFTYVVDDDADMPDNVGRKEEVLSENTSASVYFQDEAPQTNRREEEPVHAKHSSNVMPPPVPPPYTSSSEPRFFQDPRKILGTPPPPMPEPKPSRTYGCLKGCAMIFTGLLLVFVFIIYQCEPSKSYTADALEISEDAESSSSLGAASGEVPAFDRRLGAEKPPSWIQGRWHVDTDYGGITLVIHKDRITEISGGQMCHGTFKYQNNHLYCVFGKKNVFVYRLIEDRRQIDAGAGLPMKKTD